MLENYTLLVLAPILGMVSNILVHVIVSRFNQRRSQIKCLIFGFISGLICVVILSLVTYCKQINNLDFIAYLLLGCIAYSAFAYVYFHFININIASLRIRILQEVIDSPDGLTEEGILSRYNVEQMLDNRIQRLVDSGQLIEKQGVYSLGSNRIFLTLFWFFEALKFIFLGRGNRLLSPNDQQPLSFGLLIRVLWQNQFFRFLCIGAINTLFGYCAYAFLVILNIDYRIALTISTTLAVLFNYYTNGRFVFRNSGKKVLLRFILLNVIMYIFNQLLLITLVSLRMGKLVSQALIVPIVIIITFIINKRWVFFKGKS
ncbi:MAG: GtrA family protein [Candidatus Omnitrophica bacterium]|nr:GtrA family protein [Candidatus Omnitrophota bacterium]